MAASRACGNPAGTSPWAMRLNLMGKTNMAASRIDPASGKKIAATGIPWYEEADYPAVLAMMADADRLPRTHAEWLQRAQKLEREVASQGTRTIRVILKPQAFATWCALRGHAHINAKARASFAAEQAARQIGL